MKEIEELKKMLLAYENAHTPPSRQRHYPKREKKEGAKIGAPKGHKGVTRRTPKPTETKDLHLDVCPECQSLLGKPKKIIKRIIEEIPDPQPLRVIEFLIPHYFCKNCDKKVVPSHPELPKKGNFLNSRNIRH